MNDPNGSPGKGPSADRPRPVFAYLGIACAVLSLPFGLIAARALTIFVGYYSVWIGLLTFLALTTLGLMSSGWALLRRESPAALPIVAAVANIAVVVGLLIFLY